MENIPASRFGALKEQDPSGTCFDVQVIHWTCAGPFVARVDWAWRTYQMSPANAMETRKTNGCNLGVGQSNSSSYSRVCQFTFYRNFKEL